MNTLPAFREVSFTVAEIDGKPAVTAPDLARALGYARPDDVARIYRRNAAEFTDSMTAVIRLSQVVSQRQSGVVTPSDKQSDTRIFSLRGAHLVAMFARTEIAAEFRRWVLDLIEGLERGGMPTLSNDPLAQFQRWLSPRTHVYLWQVQQQFGFTRDEAERVLRRHLWHDAWIPNRLGGIEE